jgi:hypothetical protein
MARIAIAALLAVLVVGVLWIAGEMHVGICQHAGKINCTVLPWSGDRGTPRVDWGRGSSGGITGLPVERRLPA